VEDRSKLILDRSVKSFANSVGLRILDSDRHWLDPIACESSLKRWSSKLTSLIVDDSSRSRIPSEPAVFKPHCDLFARTVVDSYNFAKASANVDDGQCFDDKFPASNIDLPWVMYPSPRRACKIGTICSVPHRETGGSAPSL
jgi:hypothetical protein